MKKLFLLLSFLLYQYENSFAQTTKFTISGTVKESGSGKLLPGVSVYVQGQKIGTQTNNYGFYSMYCGSGFSKVAFFALTKNTELRTNKKG